MNTTPSTPPRQATAQITSGASESTYVDWPAIVAGAVMATAISILLIGFGAGLGLSLTSPYRGEGVSAPWATIAAGIWLAWVMVTGFGTGGYIAGRMRRKAYDATADEVAARDGLHGLIVWATGILVGSVLAAMGIGSLLTTGGAVVGKTVDVISQSVSEADSSDYFANLMLRTVPATTTEVQAPPATSVEPSASPARSPVSSNGITAPIRGAIDPSIQAQIAAIIGRTLSSGEIADRDLDYLAMLIATNSDMDVIAARTRVTDVQAEIAQARTDTLAAIEKARVVGIIFGFIAAATLLLGAIAAFFAAQAGGRHRDAGLGFVISPPQR